MGALGGLHRPKAGAVHRFLDSVTCVDPLYGVAKRESWYGRAGATGFVQNARNEVVRYNGACGIVNEQQFTVRRQSAQPTADGVLAGVPSGHNGAYLLEWGRRRAQTVELLWGPGDDDAIFISKMATAISKNYGDYVYEAPVQFAKWFN